MHDRLVCRRIDAVHQCFLVHAGSVTRLRLQSKVHVLHL